VTKLFLGGSGLTVANGLTMPDLSVAATDRALLRAAERVIVTVDHCKIGRTTLCQTAPIDRIHTLITDSGIKSADHEALTGAGVQVVVV